MWTIRAKRVAVGEPTGLAREGRRDARACVLPPRRPARHAGRHHRDGDRDRRPVVAHRVHIRRRPPRLPSGPGQRQGRVDVRGLPAVRTVNIAWTTGVTRSARAPGLGGYPAEGARPGGHRREQNRSTDPEMDRQAPPEAASRPGERVDCRWVPCSSATAAWSGGLPAEGADAVVAKRNAASRDYGNGYP